MEADLEKNQQALSKQRWFVESMVDDQKSEQVMQTLEVGLSNFP